MIWWQKDGALLPDACVRNAVLELPNEQIRTAGGH